MKYFTTKQVSFLHTVYVNRILEQDNPHGGTNYYYFFLIEGQAQAANMQKCSHY